MSVKYMSVNRKYHYKNRMFNLTLQAVQMIKIHGMQSSILLHVTIIVRIHPPPSLLYCSRSGGLVFLAGLVLELGSLALTTGTFLSITGS